MFHDVDLIELSTVVFLQRKGHFVLICKPIKHTKEVDLQSYVNFFM